MPGEYYSVNPIAINHRKVDVLTENCRVDPWFDFGFSFLWVPFLPWFKGNQEGLRGLERLDGLYCPLGRKANRGFVFGEHLSILPVAQTSPP